MSDHSENTVLNLDVKRITNKARVELEGARNTLNILPWDLGVQQVIKLAGLTINDDICAQGIKTLASSHAAQLGHATLESFVSSSYENDGMALDWTDFSKRMLALSSRQRLMIGDDIGYPEINARVSDAEKILGRAPRTGSEYHEAIKSKLRQDFDRLKAETDARFAQMESNVKTMVRDLSDANDREAQAKAEARRISAECATRIQEINRETAQLAEGYERQADKAVSDARVEFERESEALSSSLRAEMASALSAASSAKAQIEGQLAAIQNKVATGELVSRSVVMDLEAQLAAIKVTEGELRSNISAFNERVEADKVKIQSLNAEAAMLKDEIVELKAEVVEMEARNRELMTVRLGASDFAIMRERIEMRGEQVAELQAKLDHATNENIVLNSDLGRMSGRYEQLRITHRHYQKSTRSDIAKLAECNTNNASRYREVRLYLLVMTGVAALGGIFAGFKMF